MTGPMSPRFAQAASIRPQSRPRRVPRAAAVALCLRLSGASRMVRATGAGLALGVVLISPLAPLPARAATTTVLVTTFRFDPAEVTIAAGDSVRWVWEFGTHTITEGSDCVAPPDPLFDATMDPAHPVFIYRFENTGIVDYFCRPHCVIMGMKGTVTVVAPGGVSSDAGRPFEAALLGSWPNPARGGANLRFRTPDPGPVALEVRDASGRAIRALDAGRMEAGEHSLFWDGRDASGRRVPSGVYFVRMLSPGAGKIERLVLLQ